MKKKGCTPKKRVIVKVMNACLKMREGNIIHSHE